MSRFDEYYQSIYGERWPKLKEALLKEKIQTELSEGLKQTYYIDTASLMPVPLLEIMPGQDVLDMCAAPGGKTLQIALALDGKGSLTANDRSADRRKRLRQVIADHLSDDLARLISITSHDASRWGLYEKDRYDAVLLDAPCSSERHVLGSPVHLEQWSPSRSKRLAVQQFAMLAAALDAAKPGGAIVYSTCSISPQENDAIIARLHKKRSGLFKTDLKVTSFGETTEYGRQIFPDLCGGAGPLYFAKIIKL